MLTLFFLAVPLLAIQMQQLCITSVPKKLEQQTLEDIAAPNTDCSSQEAYMEGERRGFNKQLTSLRNLLGMLHTNGSSPKLLHQMILRLTCQLGLVGKQMHNYCLIHLAVV